MTLYSRLRGFLKFFELLVSRMYVWFIDRTASNNSLNNVDEGSATLFSDSEGSKDFKDRRKSLPKKLKKKAISLDVANEKVHE